MRIAVTGGIGSGKSSFCKWLTEEGQKVFSCDRIYGALIDYDPEFKEKILKAFPAAKGADGKVDRKALSAIVFEDKRKREQLNGITHPLIMKALFREMDKYAISFAEVPLLFEGGYEKNFDKVIIMMRDDRERVKAIMERNGLTYDEADARLKAQANYDKIPIHKYFVVYNNGTVEDLHDKAIYILANITN